MFNGEACQPFFNNLFLQCVIMGEGLMHFLSVYKGWALPVARAT